ncbi:MarR family transcriptional regulator [Streptomyces sp. UNOB3_S3]|uniref:MarR family transcriptional regulator n=1 Tax=Streptomyces sp. UNOB3_S3 TaxID=2871682 RepID=UPI0035B384ED
MCRSRGTGLTTGSATRLVDRLEKAEPVTRRRDTADRRLVYVSLTLDRRPDIVSARRAADDAKDALLASYDTEQLAAVAVADYLTRTADCIDRLTDDLRAHRPAAQGK